MDDQDLRANKKLCLEQLRLSKWQLIWNKEHDIRMLGAERKELTRMELSGKGTPEGIAKINMALDQREKQAQDDISYARMEIAELDVEVKEAGVVVVKAASGTGGPGVSP